MVRIALGTTVAVCLLVVFAPRVRGDGSGPARDPHAALRDDLDRVTRESPLLRPGRSRAGVGIHVIDLETGAEVFAREAGTPRNPASNAKLLVAATALWTVGPAHTVRTELLGQLDVDAVTGDLVLRGRGDPTLRAEDLWGLAREARARGLVRVEGGVVIDGSYFGDGPLPFAFDSQPGEDAAFRAPIGAASVDANAVRFHLGPGDAPGDPPRAFAWPEGYVAFDLDARTDPGSGNTLGLFASAADDGRLAARLWGSIGIDASFGEYERRVDDPVRFAGLLLIEALEDAGIPVGRHTVRSGTTPDGATVLAERDSEPLSAWLWRLGKESSNFHAEQLLRIVGAEERGAPGTADTGATVVVETLRAHEVPVEGLVLRNGSGLWEAVKVSPRTLTALLRAAYRDVSVRPDFLAQLAVAGTDGTLARRLRDVRGRVRAKTGTLATVSALSGYALDPDGDGGFAFSVLVDDARGCTAEAKALQDAVAASLADAAAR